VIVDEVTIYCKAGDGGAGCTCNMMYSARRIIGGGGKGGNGGSVLLRVSPHHSDLVWFRGRKEFIAENGARGDYNNRKGKVAENFYVNVPLGTIVRDLEHNVIVDLNQKDQEYVICHGARGGEGNFKKFYSLPPAIGEEKEAILDYRIPVQAAFIGFANAGKTLIFNKLTGKNFKVADYPFTTQSQVWADVEFEYKLFSLMDTPPIKPSHDESHDHNYFLRHLYRPRVLIFVSGNADTYKQEFKQLKAEIELSDETLLEGKKIFYVLNKTDTMKKIPKDKKLICISALKGTGIEDLRETLFNATRSAT
jgi:GTP-binding protein